MMVYSACIELFALVLKAPKTMMKESLLVKRNSDKWMGRRKMTYDY
jgi:hypothetical protein